MNADFRGRRALVTGASGGLGADFARELARRGCNLVLSARSEDRLNALAQEVRSQHDVEVEVLPADLAQPDAVAALFARSTADGAPIDVLVNNAGYGLYGEFAELEWAAQRQMLEVDVLAPLQLTRLCVEPMRERGWGRILQVSSIGAFQPASMYAAYAASKSLVLHFGEALDFELHGTGVSCTVLTPGITRTGFFDRSGQQRRTLYQRAIMMESADVARIGIRGLQKRRRVVVPGWLNWWTVFSVRLMPRRMSVWVCDKLMRSPPS